MPELDTPARFRRNATRTFRLVVVALVLLLIGVMALGWWVGRWWGLGVGATVGSLVFSAGLTAAGMLYAMSQDGG